MIKLNTWKFIKLKPISENLQRFPTQVRGGGAYHTYRAQKKRGFKLKKKKHL